MGLGCVEVMVGKRGMREIMAERKLSAMWIEWRWKDGNEGFSRADGFWW